MIFVLVVLLLIAFVLELQNYKGKNVFYWGSIIFLIFLEAFRYQSGTDYLYYLENFEKIKTQDSNHQFTQEPLYSATVLFMKKTGASYELFALVYYIVLNLLLHLSFKKVTPFYVTAFFFFNSITLAYLGCNRQIMALALLLFSTIHYYKERIVWILYIALAATFHYSALAFLPIPFFRARIQPRQMFMLFILIIVLAISNLNHQAIKFAVENFAPKDSYTYYLGELMKINNFDDAVSFLLGLGRRLIPILLIIRFKNAFTNQILCSIFTNVHFFSLLMYVGSLNTLSVFNARLSLYFIIFEAITYSLFMAMLYKHNYRYKWWLAGGFAIYALLLMFKGLNSYIHLFIPFKTIYFTL